MPSYKLTVSDIQKKWLATGLILFIAFIILSDPALAQGFGQVESALDKIVNAMTGTIAKSIATIAVAGTGIAWIAGYIEMRKAFFVCVGISIIFGASQIVGMLSS
ncbi:TrbC/VirB2 family protein [Bartonella schoenbuchensis]|uniref:Type IV secretion system protein VirB2 n=3 Tax=Bartonella schoenbuchensis TaxID=165694 RepID=E6Z0P9_BARSR|nr:TrbC/VirB2 family protein [Bartonella schoenbuchensis]AQX31580.1 type IV secretion system protein VirB2 [Bartonella schoenbuchensis R1]ENN90415.1 type IV secretion protein VblB2 [Bartonella schoenbuchensis m07a]CBI82687.1 VbhB2 precursor [Bartonella schoenbuchensis R1]CDP79600.1 VblB2 protein [Bartonella schoenbuchensis]CDP79619.1 VblB2 protein [Bartonella schoenbuchensis]